MKTKKRKSKGLVNFQLTPKEKKNMYALRAARESYLNRHVNLWEIKGDLKQYGFNGMDFTTGMPKKIDFDFLTAWKEDMNPPRSEIVIPLGLMEFPLPNAAPSFDALRVAMDRCPYMAWAAAPNTECLHVNPALTTYAGDAPREDFLVLGWANYLHPDDVTATIDLCRKNFKAVKPAPFRMAYRMKRKDGLYALIIDAAYPWYFTNGNYGGFVGTMYEIAAPGQEVEVAVYENNRWVLRKKVIIPEQQGDKNGHICDIRFIELKGLSRATS